MSKQSVLARGIYEFQDPAGTLLAVKVPYTGSTDLYDGTHVVVRPNQCAIFIYNGDLAEVLSNGNHEIHTDNFPILTKLANWKFGFESPLRCELWFISLGLFAGRHWGTASPIMAALPSLGTIPLRAHGNFNFRILDPKVFFIKMLNSQSSYDVSDLDNFVQGLISELLPKALSVIQKVQDLNSKQIEVSQKLEALVNQRLIEFGFRLEATQVAAISPPQEVLTALDEKLAMDVIGDKRDYLMYKMANSLDQFKQGAGGGTDHGQLVMSLMMSRGLLGGATPGAAPAQTTPAAIADEHKASPFSYVKCAACMNFTDPSNRFCPNCGKKL